MITTDENGVRTQTPSEGNSLIEFSGSTYYSQIVILGVNASEWLEVPTPQKNTTTTSLPTN